VNQTQVAPARHSGFGAALAGGVIGSALTAALLFFAAPTMLSSKIVRQGLLSDPQILTDTVQALRDAQYQPVLAANRAAIETPFASSWKGAAKPEVTLVEFFDYACPYCKASNPAVDRLLQEDKGLRVVYRELPILGPDSVTAARLSLEASKLGRFAQFHDALWAAGRPAPDTIATAAHSAGIAPSPAQDTAIETELAQNRSLAGELGATGTPVFVVGDRVLNGAVGYDMLKDAIATARAKS
jgi:protein-disulfide isomerase